MATTFFEEQYPFITGLYYDYVNTDEHDKSPIVEQTEPITSEAVDKAFELLKKGDEVEAAAALLSGAVEYEHCGFILGFIYAMNLMQESKKTVKCGGV